MWIITSFSQFPLLCLQIGNSWGQRHCLFWVVCSPVHPYICTAITVRNKTCDKISVWDITRGFHAKMLLSYFDLWGALLLSNVTQKSGHVLRFIVTWTITHFKGYFCGLRQNCDVILYEVWSSCSPILIELSMAINITYYNYSFRWCSPLKLLQKQLIPSVLSCVHNVKRVCCVTPCVSTHACVYSH